MEENFEDEHDPERTEIREELSSMSFGDLLKLKEELGTKVYNEAMFGSSCSQKKTYKRENKNRPREMSSKKPVPVLRNEVPVNKDEPRDPRFDGLCGTFNEKAFKSRYQFLSELRAGELKQLKDELNGTSDNDRKGQIKYLIQRMENQLREEELRKKQEIRLQEEKDAKLEALKDGKKPYFRKKSERRIIELVDRFEDLKKRGKLSQNIQKFRKKIVQKNRRRFPAE